MDEILQNNFSEAQQKNVEKKPNEGEAPAKVTEKPAPKPYPVFGRDISIFEGDFIDFYKARMKIMAIKFKLVGQVNNQKKYFYFHVKLESNDDGTAKATLYLSEFVDGFLGQDYIVTPVAEYTSVNDDEFRIRVRKAFHLVDVEVKNDDTAVPDLAVIMQDAIDMELLLGGFFDMAGQLYLMKMLKVLEESKNPTCKRVLDRYHELLALQNMDMNEKFKYIKYKALLDNAIDEVGGLEKLGIGFDVLRPIIADYNKITQMITSARKGILEMDTPVQPDLIKQMTNNPATAAKKQTATPPKTAGKQPPPKTQPQKKPEAKKPPIAEEKPSGSSYDYYQPPKPEKGISRTPGADKQRKSSDGRQVTPENKNVNKNQNQGQGTANGQPRRTTATPTPPTMPSENNSTQNGQQGGGSEGENTNNSSAVDYSELLTDGDADLGNIVSTEGEENETDLGEGVTADEGEEIINENDAQTVDNDREMTM